MFNWVFLLHFANCSIRGSGSPLMSNSPIHMTKFDGLFSSGNSNGGGANGNAGGAGAGGNGNGNGTNPIGINSVSSTNSNVKIIDQNMLSPATPQQACIDTDEYQNSSGAFVNTPLNISKDTTPMLLGQWLQMQRLGQYVTTFAQFSGADIYRLSKEDLVQICGLADGIRLYNTLHSKWAIGRFFVAVLSFDGIFPNIVLSCPIFSARAIAPRLTIYVSFDGSSYHAIYLHANTAKELIQKIVKLPGFTDCLANASANVENTMFPGWSKFQTLKLTKRPSNSYRSFIICLDRLAIKIFRKRIESVRFDEIQCVHQWSGWYSCLCHRRSAQQCQRRKSVHTGNCRQQQDHHENGLQKWDLKCACESADIDTGQTPIILHSVFFFYSFPFILGFFQ